MASLLPIIDDILPMILPTSVSITKKTDIIPLVPPMVPNADGTPGTHRVRVYSRDAVVGRLDKICSTVLVLSPNTYSTIRHYGEQDAILYVALGSGVLLTASSSKEKDEDDPERHELGQGDFAAVPAWTEHQVLNESTDQDAHWVIIRSGGHPVEVHLKGWGRGKAEYPPSRA
ncbi:RmlC-like cupin domain-containing protein [Sordaria brevicollis]|uniref:RmlC-like cupin domain-containing protein n=1 Tax=Sordaria brevicollis TaxID=83679 RepID=A0AAE0NVR1_SORBR|nr:RmlC-like cupin domain-containing protein [Sordaria brevicollis]